MSKIYKSVIALAFLAVLLAFPPMAHAQNVTVPHPTAVWNAGVLQGFGIPGKGQLGYTLVQTLNAGGGISLPNGTVGTPALNFTSDTDTGLYRIGANNAGFAVNGAKVLDIGTAGLGVTGTLGSTSDFAVATNKFNVTAASGNTAVAGTLGVTGLATLTAGANSADNITMTAAAKGIVLKQGANGRTGTFVCNGVTPVSVGNTSFAITDILEVSLNTVGGTVGALPHQATVTGATGFTVVCTAADTSTYNYALTASAP